ncbi:DUF6968 family protein [Sorangium cellulosum]|jgi:hypothetical protein|nr:hypothetical protein [Sorangium cellulosum]
MDDVIAERELTFQAAGSDMEERVMVRLGRPRVEAHRPLYTLRYEIIGPAGRQVNHFACGEDSMQALSLVFIAINARLDHIKRLGRLTWLGSEDLHFPAGA